MADVLEKGGYGSVGAISRETDLDRFALKVKMPHELASEIKEDVTRFLADHWPAIETGVAAAAAEHAARMPLEESADDASMDANSMDASPMDANRE